jgi:transposase
VSTSTLRGHVTTTPDHISDGRRRRRTHRSEFKAQVVAACSDPGISIAAVAMANGINANLARRWVMEAERSTSGAVRLPARASGVAQSPAFAVVQLPLSQPTADIRIELRRGATAITVHWPSVEAAQCAPCMSDLLP